MQAFALTRPLLVSALIVVLGACATVSAHGEQSATTVDDVHDFTMQPGTQVALPDQGTLRYLRVVNDSRCKPGVQCIWAGDAEVAFRWTPGSGAAQDFSLHTGKAPKEWRLGERRLALLSLAPGEAPSAVLRIEPAAAP